MGKSGKAAMNVLSGITTKIFIYDDNLKINNKKKSVIWKHYEDWEWDKLHSLVISPGIKIEGQNQHKCVLLAKKFNVHLINEIQLLIESQPLAKIIGITGTNGKSTLVSLLSHIFNSNKINNKIGGNFGTPACLLQDPGINGFIILELSSFQLLSISNLKLEAATIINISPDHIDYHGSFQSYVKAKLNIIKFLKPSSKLFINHDDKNLINFIKKNRNLNSKNIQYISPQDNFKHLENLTGDHNKIICKIAFEICRFFGLKENDILPFFKSFTPLPHRMEVVFSSKKILIINDSKATNGVSTSAALSSYDNIYWIAGGLSKTNGIKDCIGNLKMSLIFRYLEVQDISLKSNYLE